MENVVVDVLLGVGVGAELLCVAGVLLMPSAFDRLHYVAASTAVGPFLILAALLVREGVSSSGLEAIAAVGILFLINPTLIHATSRAARRTDFGDVAPLPEERGR